MSVEVQMDGDWRNPAKWNISVATNVEGKNLLGRLVTLVH